MIFARAIRSKKIRGSQIMQGEIAAELKKLGGDIRRNYEAITANWRHKPKFEEELEVARTGVSVTVEPKMDEAGRIFQWTDYGTMPHWIRAKRGPYLRFRWPYRPKTFGGPARLRVSAGGGTAGPNWATKREVWHPGTQPRDFTVQLAEYWAVEGRRRIDNAIRRARRRIDC